MGIVNGTSFVIYDNDIGIGHTKSCAISFKMNMGSSTTKDSQGWEEVIAGKRDATIKAEGLVDYSQQITFDDFYLRIINKTYTKWIFTDGTQYYMGAGYIKNCEQISDMEQTVKFSIDVQMSGPIFTSFHLPWNLVFANWEDININWENV